ncbi:MAG TPA: hypothetical protein VG963_03790 [Polyangiaceae bacterium]|nr:hypothetical protein [Polyangiaceae bacterium]
MKSLVTFSVFALCLGLGSLGCKDNKDDGADDEVSTAGSNSLLPETPIAGALGPGNPPALGPRLDRAGRPAISAALIETFSGDADKTNQAHADYNAAGLSNQTFAATMKTSLAILDALDGTCGNQLLAGPGQDRYAPLTNALLDDQLYLNSDKSGSVYLGVELEAITAKSLSPASGAGGGRQPGDDVIERSYSELAAGQTGGIDDGIPQDDVVHDPNRFPFISPPQN